MFELSTPVTDLKMIGPVLSDKLLKLNISTIGDLIRHYPSRYIDYSLKSSINSLQCGETVSLNAIIDSIQSIYTKTGKRLQKAQVSDGTGILTVVWYNQPFLTNILKPGAAVSLSGKVSFFGNKLSLESPDYEILFPGKNTIHTGRIIPVYPESEGISSKWLRSRIYPLLFKFNLNFPENLPEHLLSQHQLISRQKSILDIHFPEIISDIHKAQRRLAFEEMFLLQLSVQKRKLALKKEKVVCRLAITGNMKKLNELVNNLPFKLTSSQDIAISEILKDLGGETPMNRLLEGDVGSGKTVIAAIACYAVYLNNRKSVIMSPTEILANQHYQTMRKLLEPYGINIGLYTSSHKSSIEADIMIGTHALLADKLNLKKVSLIVIDEQQRFGVKQRALLKDKNMKPHLLTMTATPIPRTLALTLFADLDLSVLTHMPKGRQKIKSWVVPSYKRKAAYEWIRKEIKEKNNKIQAIIVCPFIEESETMETVKAAKIEFRKLKEEIFPDLKLELLHGRMKSTDKTKVMERLKTGDINILVSTPIIEVGIDIPTLSIMMIEAADRFGLAQLHQLRGRVGRGNNQSYCLLFSQTENPKSLKRLKYMETTDNGPQLAEIDLHLRGAGQIYGLKQHGRLSGLKLASISDLNLISETRNAAQNLLLSDPDLSKYEGLRKYVQNYTIGEVSED